MPEQDTEKTVLSHKLSGGPHGLGDPQDQTLRRVEIDVLIPKIMRDLARSEKCGKEVQEFTKCCQDSSVLMVVKCRKENSNLKDCLTKWYNDEAFKEHCKHLYLKERSEFRETGIPKKKRPLGSSRIQSNM